MNNTSANQSFGDNNVEYRTIMRQDPPAIQVDMPSGLISNRRIHPSHPNCFFYLSTLPIVMQPIIILRVLQHRMFGCIAYWAWHSNAMSRASVASVSGSSVEFVRSRASSNASNANLEIQALNLKRNLGLHCSNTSLSPSRYEIERKASIKSNNVHPVIDSPRLSLIFMIGIIDNRLTPQNSLPLGQGGPGTVHMSNSLSTINPNNVSSMYSSNKLPIHSPFQRLSLIDQQLMQSLDHQRMVMDSPTECTLNRRFRYSSSNCHRTSSQSTENSETARRNSSLDACDRNEAFILAFQRELQNLPKNESPSPVFGSSVQQRQEHLTNSLASIIREAFERNNVNSSASNSNRRPRSSSVPRITLDNFSSTLLQLPGAASTSSNASCQTQPATSGNLDKCANLLIRHVGSADGTMGNQNTIHVYNSGMIMM